MGVSCSNPRRFIWSPIIFTVCFEITCILWCHSKHCCELIGLWWSNNAGICLMVALTATLTHTHTDVVKRIRTLYETRELPRRFVELSCINNNTQILTLLISRVCIIRAHHHIFLQGVPRTRAFRGLDSLTPRRVQIPIQIWTVWVPRWWTWLDGCPL